MQTQNLQIIPRGIKPIIKASQFDVGREFQLKLYDGAVAYTPPTGTTLRLDGVKPDGTVFSYTENLSLSGSTITVTTTTQMTILEGTVQCEIRMTKDNEDIGTINFDLMVEKSPINETTDLSQTEIPALVTLARMQMENAEAWAVGTKDGVPVTSDDPQYHNNAKYYSDVVQAQAEAAAASATSAASSATSASNAASNAASSATAAGNAADRAEAAVVLEPYIGANGNWFVYDFTTQQYTDTNVKAQGPQGIQGQPGEDGTNGTDGVGIVSITKTATQGLVDTYTVLLTNEQTYTFTVTNGQNGTGSGDMLAANYDPNQAVYNAGGIVAYVAAQISGLSISLNGLTDVALTSLAAGQSLIYDATEQKWVNGSISASNVNYTNTTSGLTATKVQNAIDEVAAKNQTLTQKTDDIEDNQRFNGCFNLCPNNLTSQTFGGVQFTVNANKSITMTPTSSVIGGGINIFEDSNNPIVLERSAILYFGDNTYPLSLEIIATYSDDSSVVLNSSANKATLHSGNIKRVRIYFNNTFNQTMTLYPMISYYDGDYVPHVKTNRELTEYTSDVSSHSYTKDGILVRVYRCGRQVMFLLGGTATADIAASTVLCTLDSKFVPYEVVNSIAIKGANTVVGKLNISTNGQVYFDTAISNGEGPRLTSLSYIAKNP